MSAPPTQRPGRVITFYSYKGGTGRSMALSNVAWILASAGKRVLVIDWDLEAPGLHRYFRPFLVDAELGSSDGLMDLIDHYACEAIRPPPEGFSPAADWWLPLTDFSEHVLGVGFAGFPAGGCIDLLPAGRQSESYAIKVSAFNWQNFFDRLGGGGFLDAVRERARSEYDYVLIDSRTGVSDTAGICTAQMPDTLVVCFTYNNQSILGAAAVAASARRLQSAVSAQRRAAAPGTGDSNMPLADTPLPYRVLPVPMRVDAGESDRLALRQGLARDAFAELLGPGLITGDAAAYWGAVEVPHRVFYAYEEVLAPLKDDPQDPKTVLAAFVRLAREITLGEVPDYRLPMAPELRQQLLDAYAETPQTAAARQARRLASQESELAQQIRQFDSALLALGDAERQIARSVLCRVVRLGREDEGGGQFAVRMPLSEFEPTHQGMINELAQRGLLSLATEAHGGNSAPPSTVQMVGLAHDILLAHSTLLQGWLTEDREFLLWRQQLRAYRHDWDRTGERSALLAGTPLTDARRWLRQRPQDLNALERLYIDTSLAETEPPQAVTAGVADEPTPAYATAPTRRLGWRWSVLALAGLVCLALVWFGLSPRVASTSHSIGSAASSTATPTAIDVNSQLASAAQQIKEGRLAEADAAYQRVLLASPNNLEALLQLGRIRDLNSDYAGAADMYVRAIAAAPTAAQPFIDRAASNSQQGRFEAAWADLNAALELEPSNVLAYYNRGVVHENLKRSKDALADYNRALALNAGLVPALLRRAALLEKSNPAAARADYQTVLRQPDENNSVQTAQQRLIAMGAERPTKTDGGTPSSGNTQRVLIQFSDESDRSAVEALRLALGRELSAVTMPGIERVSVRSSGEVRYFFVDDRKLAERVANAAELQLAKAGTPRPLRATFRDAKDYPNASSGTVELWLPALRVLPPTRALTRPEGG